MCPYLVCEPDQNNIFFDKDSDFIVSKLVAGSNDQDHKQLQYLMRLSPYMWTRIVFQK